MVTDTEQDFVEPNIVRSIWRHRVLVVSLAALVAVLGTLAYGSRPVTYASEAGVLLEDPRSTLASESASRDAVRYIANQVAVMNSNTLLRQASALTQNVEGVTGMSAGDLARSMKIQTDDGSNFVVVRVTADKPATARVAADAVVNAYRAVVRADVQGEAAVALRTLGAAIKVAARTLGNPNRTLVEAQTAGALMQQLRVKRNQIQVDAQLAGDGVALFSPAGPGRGQGASLMASLVIGLVLGGLVGCGAAYLLDVRSARRSTRHRSLGEGLLTEVPNFATEGVPSKLPVLDAPHTKAAEAFRLLAAMVGFPLDPAAKLPMVAFLSAAPRDGTTTVVANTAIAAANAGRKILLLDADLNGRGLTTLLLGHQSLTGSEGVFLGVTGVASPELAHRRVKHLLRNENGGSLSLVEPGSSTLEAMYAIKSQQNGEIINQTADQFDWVFIDVPPGLQFPWADLLLKMVESVVVVVGERPDLDASEEMLDRLRALGVTSVGHVRNIAPRERGRRREFLPTLPAWRRRPRAAGGPPTPAPSRKLHAPSPPLGAPSGPSPTTQPQPKPVVHRLR